METLLVQNLNVAIQALRLAEDEYSKPDEDVITSCSCHFTRMALNGLLRSYLLFQGTTAAPAMQSETLLNLCSRYDRDFSGIQLDSFLCSHDSRTPEGELYCRSIENVAACLITTRAVKEIVLTKMNIRESELA